MGDKKGEKSEADIQATFADGEGEGMVYARCEKLGALVKRFNGQQNVYIIKALAKFEEYALP